MQPTPIPPGTVVARPPPNLTPGTTIADKYRVERELGRGGFGVVVRATHLALMRPVAIKVLTDCEGTEREWMEDAERFRREARATAALKCDHVVQILDVDTLPGGSPYIVMEYLEGETLFQAMLSHGMFSVVDAVDIILQVLVALAEAHAAGIVHRDLKPANIFLSRGPSGLPIVKVLDFGVSKIGGAGGMITRTGAVLGTIAYMAPEQVRDAKRVDGRVDVWSAGQILYELLTRRLPFGPATSPSLMTAILTSPPVRPSAIRPDLPPELDRILLGCMEKEASRRTSSVVELGLSLAPFASVRAAAVLDRLQRVDAPAGAASLVPQAASMAVPVASARPPTTFLLLALAFAVAAATITIGAVLMVVLSR